MKDRILLPSDVHKIMISKSPFYLLIVSPFSLNIKEIMENVLHKNHYNQPNSSMRMTSENEAEPNLSESCTRTVSIATV